MSRFLQKLITIFILSFFSIFNFVPASFAQKFSPMVAVAGNLKQTDSTEARPGLIVAKDPTEYYITRSYQDQYIAGVIVENADLLYTF